MIPDKQEDLGSADRVQLPSRSGAGFLVLSRKVGERIEIGGGVTVEVCGISGTRVKLGVVAPPEMKISRSTKGHDGTGQIASTES